jgi:hypothetical protein
MRIRRASRPLERLVLVVLAGACVAGCAEWHTREDVSGAEQELRQEVADLRVLVRRAERTGLVARDGMVVAVGERLIRELVGFTLPTERVLEGGFRLRLETAEVDLREGRGDVQLEGRVSAVDEPGVLLDLTVRAHTGTVSVDRDAGRLSVQVVPTGFEIHRVGVGEEDSRTRAVAEAVTRAVAGALTGLATPISVPVAFEREVHLGALQAGPVSATAASVPLRIVVRDVSVHGGRLWVVLGIEAGRWTPEARG